MIQKYEKSLGLGFGLKVKSLGLENYGGLGLGLDNKVLFTSLAEIRLADDAFYH